jgi:hypothetical protein
VSVAGTTGAGSFQGDDIARQSRFGQLVFERGSRASSLDACVCPGLFLDLRIQKARCRAIVASRQAGQWPCAQPCWY